MKTDNRKLIESKVKQNKGITFTQLKKETDLENGVLQYHIEKSDKIEKKNKAILPKEECKTCKYEKICKQKCIASILRNPNKRKILELKRKGLRQIDIAEKLDLDKSTINYHVKDLKKNNLLDKNQDVREKVSENL